MKEIELFSDISTNACNKSIYIWEKVVVMIICIIYTEAWQKVFFLSKNNEYICFAIICNWLNVTSEIQSTKFSFEYFFSKTWTILYAFSIII